MVSRRISHTWVMITDKLEYFIIAFFSVPDVTLNFTIYFVSLTKLVANFGLFIL